MSDKKDEKGKINHLKGRRWPLQIKQQAVDDVDSGRLTIPQAQAKYGVRSNNTIPNWRDQIARGVQRPRSRVPEALKRRLALEVKQGLITIEQVMQEHSIYDRSTVRSWIARYCSSDSAMKKPPEKHLQDADLQSENADLKDELEHFRLKNLGLETMIEVAEEEFGIQIRKKSGTKQSEE